MHGAGCRVASRRDGTDRLAAADGCTDLVIGPNRLKGRDQAIAMIDRDDRSPRNHAREGDHPRRRRSDTVVCSDDVDSAVTGPIWVRRANEPVHDLGSRDRP